MTFVKICGITDPEDARAACDAGADAIGVIFAPSKRQVDLPRAKAVRAVVPPGTPLVGVFLDQPLSEIQAAVEAVGLDWVQLHGREPVALLAQIGRPIIKRHDIPSAGRPALLEQLQEYHPAAWHLLDPGAGSGRTFDWTLARDLPGPVVVSGGLHPDNVRDAIRAARPAGVDVASGVEHAPGQKDHAAMRRFVEEVRAEDADANDNG